MEERREAFAEAAALSAGVLDALSDGVLLLARGGEVRLFNRAALAILPELRSGWVLARLYPQFYAGVLAAVTKAAAGWTDSMERVFFARPDAAYYLNIRAMPGPEPGTALLVLEDVTEQAMSDSARHASFTELEAQLRVARRYQEALFTSHWEDDNLSCQAFGYPAFELSGDFFEIGRAGERYLLVLGDVQSHGIEVAIKAITLQHMTRQNIAHQPVPAQIMQTLNAFVSDNQQGSFWSSCMFIGSYDPLTRQLSYCRAGIPEPVLLRAGGGYDLLAIGDTPLGFFEQEKYRNGQVEIGAGDRLLLFSDGVTDAHAQDEPEAHYGQDRLIRDYQRLLEGGAGHHCVDLVREAQQFHGPHNAADDFTLAEVIFR